MKAFDKAWNVVKAVPPDEDDVDVTPIEQAIRSMENKRGKSLEQYGLPDETIGSKDFQRIMEYIQSPEDRKQRLKETMQEQGSPYERGMRSDYINQQTPEGKRQTYDAHLQNIPYVERGTKYGDNTPHMYRTDDGFVMFG